MSYTTLRIGLGSALIFSLLATGVSGASRTARSGKGDLAVASPGTPADAASALPLQVPALWRRLDLETLYAANSVGHWVVLLLAVLVSLIAGQILGTVLGRFGRRLEVRGWTIRAYVVIALVGPAKLALATGGLTAGFAGLEGRSVPLQSLFSKAVLLLGAMAVSWYALRLVSVVEMLLRRRPARRQSTLDQQLAPMIGKTLRVILVIVAAMFIFEAVFGWNIGAWLAGLGLAGLAISLAAQDSLKNVFGSITILLDQPFQIGETIVFSGYDGVVEEIGFRSTKIRTGAGHLVTIPNANIVNGIVERKRPSQGAFLERTMNLPLPTDTPLEKVERALVLVRRVLEEEGIGEPIHPVIDGQRRPPRVYFSDYGPASLNISITYWFVPSDPWMCLQHREKTNLRIVEEFRRAGLELAMPSQIVYVAGDPEGRRLPQVPTN